MKLPSEIKCYPMFVFYLFTPALLSHPILLSFHTNTFVFMVLYYYILWNFTVWHFHGVIDKYLNRMVRLCTV